MTFSVGSKVFKPQGYPYPGEVRSVFTNRAGDVRYVVESELAPGMLHIFSGNQLRPNPELEADRG